MVATTHACQILKLVLLAWNVRRGVDQIDLPWHIRVKGPLKGGWGGKGIISLFMCILGIITW